MVRFIMACYFLQTAYRIGYHSMDIRLSGVKEDLISKGCLLFRILGELARCIILIMHDMSKDTVITLISVIDALVVRFPYKFHFLLLLPPDLFRLINPRERNSVESHPRKELGSESWMAEWIRVPGVLRSDSECLKKESVSCHDVHDHLLVSGTCFVTGYPPSIYELKLALPHKLPYVLFHTLILHIPPLLKVVNLSLRELFGSVFH